MDKFKQFFILEMYASIFVRDVISFWWELKIKKKKIKLSKNGFFFSGIKGEAIFMPKNQIWRLWVSMLFPILGFEDSQSIIKIWMDKTYKGLKNISMIIRLGNLVFL